jgi:hypothetical protein
MHIRCFLLFYSNIAENCLKLAPKHYYCIFLFQGSLSYVFKDGHVIIFFQKVRINILTNENP